MFFLLLFTPSPPHPPLPPLPALVSVSSLFDLMLINETVSPAQFLILSAPVTFSVYISHNHFFPYIFLSYKMNKCCVFRFNSGVLTCSQTNSNCRHSSPVYVIFCSCLFYSPLTVYVVSQKILENIGAVCWIYVSTLQLLIST